jgi:hypothetical protein
MLTVREAIHNMKARGIWEISVQSSKFCYQPKTALKIVY